jgi:hypothetical protein
MRTTTRSLVLLAVALTLVAVPDVASAATKTVAASIKGAGTVTFPPAGRAGISVTCEQAPPVAESALHQCSSWPWFETATVGEQSVVLRAAAAPGWRLADWTGCASVTGTACALRAGYYQDIHVTPQVRFEDVPPAKVADLTLTPGATEGAHTMTWTADSEPDLKFQCGLNGGPAWTCRSGDRLDLTPGDRRLEVWAVDSNGHIGDVASATTTVVDTQLTDAPPFIATTRVGTEVQCSIDGAAYARCGGPSGEVTLPALADGTHTLRVRGRFRHFVDLFPETRTFMVGTAKRPVDPAPVGPAPVPATAPVPAHSEPAPVLSVTAAPVTAAAPQRLSFKLRYATRNGRLTRLAVTELAPRADLRVIVKCKRRKPCPRGFAKWNALGTVELKRLVGKRLPRGTKITVRARRGQLTATRTITFRKGA